MLKHYKYSYYLKHKTEQKTQSQHLTINIREGVLDQ